MTHISGRLQRLHVFRQHRSVILLLIPLFLSGFTHLLNPIGFPAPFLDEAHYVRRALQLMEGLGVQDVESATYDHPFFGQIFLAGIFQIIHYPEALELNLDEPHSIELLYVIPRVLMGLLAVLDTFLVFKIAEFRYNDRTVAFGSSVLFAVMPMSWMVRRVYLDSIQLPFLLSSILFAVYCARRLKRSSFSTKTYRERGEEKKKAGKHIYLVLASGVLLGLAIFTKIPAFTIIPLVAFLIYDMSRSFKTLCIWLIPVVLLPSLWPLQSVVTDNFEDWLAGVTWQATGRPDKPLVEAVQVLLQNDPVLTVLGLVGMTFLLLARRDFFLALWIIPFLVFMALIGFVSFFHFIPLIPAFCIAAARLIVEMSKGFSQSRLVGHAIISLIAIFGLVSTILVITTTISSSPFQAIAFVAEELGEKSKELNEDDSNNKSKVTVISNPTYSWIFKYVFDLDNVYLSKDNVQNELTDESTNVIIVADGGLERLIASDSNDKNIDKLKRLYDQTTRIERFEDDAPKYDIHMYPFSILLQNSWDNIIEVRTKYG